MNTWKRLGLSLLYPHLAIMVCLVPAATIFLVFSMAFAGTETIPAYISYVLAAYTLAVWCVRIPTLIRSCKTFKRENKYAVIWFGDARLRVKVTLYGSLAWNTAYAVFQLGLGFYHGSFWFYSLAGYYILLAAMRFFLAVHTSKYAAGAEMRTEIRKYRACGWVFLVMNLALVLMIFFMVYWNRTFVHHEITTIAMAAYTFTTFTMAVVNVVKYRKYNSPVYSASKVISFAAACVSMITLTSTMLTTFGAGESDLLFRKLMLGILGGAISAAIVAMAIYMIVKSTQQLRSSERTETQ